jgi:predicted  nucleic acid-binding Zn-ribbon protein
MDDQQTTSTAEPVAETQALDATALDATQNLIIRLSQQLEDMEKQQKDFKDMLKGVFDNDETLAKANQEAEAHMKTAKSRKTEISGSSEVIELRSKIADLSEDVKLIQESLNTHLLNYYQLTGSKAVDFPGGEEREMVIRAKLKKSGPKSE